MPVDLLMRLRHTDLPRGFRRAVEPLVPCRRHSVTGHIHFTDVVVATDDAVVTFETVHCPGVRFGSARVAATLGEAVRRDPWIRRDLRGFLGTICCDFSAMRDWIESILAPEYEWVVRSLFKKTSERGAHMKAKGTDGFFATIANCSEERVRRAWRLSCGEDIDKITNALEKKHARLPMAFEAKWSDAIFEVFGTRFKVVTQLKSNPKQNNKVHDLKNIKCLHLYQIIRIS